MLKITKPTFIVIALGVLALAVHFALVLILTKTGLSSISSNFSVEQLGAYGDSIAPMTAFFAALAAIYAARAYEVQQRSFRKAEKERRNRERADRTARFDALFFQAIQEHDAALDRLSRIARGRPSKSSAIKLFTELWEAWQGGACGPTPTVEFWESKLSEKTFHPVKRFVRTFYAIVSWLDVVSERNSQPDWMKLLMDRMSLSERRLIYLLLKTHAPQEVRSAAQRLGISNFQNS